MPKQLFEFSCFQAAHVHGCYQVGSEQLGQHMRVDLVVFDLGRSDRLGL
jgi:hypothetical protein